MAGLTEKQKRFIEEYLVVLNATQAAIRAGYSKKTAQEQSSRLLSNVMVADAIKEAQKKRSERTQITQDMVLKFWGSIVFTPVEELYEQGPDGYLIPMDLGKLSEDAKASIAEVTQITKENKLGDMVTIQTFRQHDKMKASENIAKHLGMFKERVEVGRASDFENLNDKEVESELNDTAKILGFEPSKQEKKGKALLQRLR